MKISTKPGRSELWLSIKICLIGIAAVGLIGYIIKVISAALNPGGAVTGT
jgi:protein translocase SEC61 complex gamma subunit